MRHRLIGCLFLLIFPGVLAAEPVRVVVAMTGTNQYSISLKTTVQARQNSLWAVLTDYDHHAGFLPYMTLSRVVETHPDYKVVKQAGQIRILFWTFTMHVLQQVREEPPRHMHFQAISGDFTHLEGDWMLTPSAGSAAITHLECQFLVQPRRRVPQWAVRLAARHYLATMVQRLQERAEERVQ